MHIHTHSVHFHSNCHNFPSKSGRFNTFGMNFIAGVLYHSTAEEDYYFY